MNHSIKGPCFHINGVTCDNCRPTNHLYPPLETQLTDHLATLYPKKKEEVMSIEKEENGFIIKYKGKIYVFDKSLPSEQLGNVIKNIFDGVQAG